MGGGKDGKGFVTVVDANARNKIVYPGSFSDADFYSKQFGEIIENEIRQTKAYGTFAGIKGLFSDKISESVASTRRARFTPEDIVFRPFGEITYCLIKNNSIQTPGASKIRYIPKELNDELDRMVAEYNDLQHKKIKEKELRENGGFEQDEAVILDENSSDDSPINRDNIDEETTDSSRHMDLSLNDSGIVNESYEHQESYSHTQTTQEDICSDDIDILGMLEEEDDDL